PDPQVPRYRFRAEVRQDSALSKLCEVGIYFCHEKLVVPEGPADSFLVVSFADGPTSLKVIKDAKGQVFHRATLDHRYFREAEVDRNYRTSISSFGKPAVKFYPPPGPDEPRWSWRRLAVEVTPGQVHVFWENQPFAIAARADLEGCVNEWLHNDAETKNLTFRLKPRG